MVTKKHKYQGDWYQIGDNFKNKSHKDWACDPVRNYGDAKKATKPAKQK